MPAKLDVITRSVTSLLATSLASVATIAAGADASTAKPAYPVKPVRIVVPYPAGGPVDITIRAIAPRLTNRSNNR